MQYLLHVEPEMVVALYCYNARVVCAGIKCVHCESWRAVDDAFSRFQHHAHEEVDQFVAAAPYLREMLKLSGG